jgi:hypothetical protein|nr:MAG TPA: hypothetical protein [Caudoviricetes sp.]
MKLKKEREKKVPFPPYPPKTPHPPFPPKRGKGKRIQSIKVSQKISLRKCYTNY